ncbi:MAG: tetratricopeptide repeat protein [Gammaproteobacteria bacterium]|nr:tetratricopeptide repeat protein [Gammaproteobacteria bacterium]
MNQTSPSTSDLFDQAFIHHRHGRTAEAKAGYLEVLNRQPGHAQALHMLGNLDLREGKLENAERLIRQAAEKDPNDAATHNSLGNVLRARGRSVDAEAAYRQAIGLDPEFGVAHGQLGQLLADRGALEEAEPVLRRALALDSSLDDALHALGKVLNNRGQREDAADVFRQLLHRKPDSAMVQNDCGHVLRAVGRFAEAARCFEKATRLDPAFARAHNNLGTVYIETGKPDAAISCFRRAAELAPGEAAYQTDLGLALHAAGRLVDAHRALARAVELDPDSSARWVHLGVLLEERRQPELAEKAMRNALQRDPDNVDAIAQLAALLEALNRVEEGAALVEQGLALAPEHPELNLEAARFSRRAGSPGDGIRRLSGFNLRSLPPRVASRFHYELGQLYDRAEDSEHAFAHLLEGNRLMRESTRLRRVDPQRYAQRVEAVHSFFRDRDPSDWSELPPSDAQPVFLIGFPRSGTTLCDVILDSHPDVQTLEEKPTMHAVEERLAAMPGGFPVGIASLSGEDAQQLREVYQSAVAEYAAGDDRLVVDKLPMRTVQAGLIWRLFPRARFVFAVRHPCDVVLSGFMQDYQLNDAFASFFSLEDAVAMYERVMGLWRLFEERLPLVSHRVRYESLVSDPRAEIGALLEFLDLPWDDQVLSFHDRVRERGLIDTTSYHQVAEPFYQRAAGRWLRYRRFFEPHMERLQPFIDYFGYPE